MKKIKYLFMRIFDFNYKAFFNTISELSEKTGKSKIFLFFDMIHCGLKYGAGYMDYKLIEFYNIEEKYRGTFITRGVNNAIVGERNNKDFVHFFDDKRDFNIKFEKYLGRKCLDMAKTDFSEFEKFIEGKDEIMVKPADDCCGRGVEKLKLKDYGSVKELYDFIKKEKIHIAEDVIKQHSEMASLNPASVNTVRVVTLSANGKSEIFYAAIRIGNGDFIVDNLNNGGMAAPVDVKTGKLTHVAFDKNQQLFEVHPNTNKQIKGFQIPFWKESVEMVLEAAKEIPEIGYVGWDVSITENGPLLIEGNPFPGHDIIQMPYEMDGKTGMYKEYKEIIKRLTA